MSARRVVQRGEVYYARLDPVEGSEQAGTRPVIIVTRQIINQNSGVIVVVPCTTYRSGQRVYPSQALLIAPDGGLERDSVAMGEQVRALAMTRLVARLGILSPAAQARVERALLITLDLPRYSAE